jgi:hypothetical protein
MLEKPKLQARTPSYMTVRRRSARKQKENKLVRIPSSLARFGGRSTGVPAQGAARMVSATQSAWLGNRIVGLSGGREPSETNLEAISFLII